MAKVSGKKRNLPRSPKRVWKPSRELEVYLKTSSLPKNEKDKNSKKLKTPKRQGLLNTPLREFNGEKTSKTISRVLEGQEYVSVFQANTDAYWRRDNPGLSYRRNKEKLSVQNRYSAYAWLHGLLKVKIDKCHYHVPENIVTIFKRCRNNSYSVEQLPTLWQARSVISFLFRTRAKVLNIFGSFSSACKRGDAVMHSIIDITNYNSQLSITNPGDNLLSPSYQSSLYITSGFNPTLCRGRL
jgi:hypothetical protein